MKQERIAGLYSEKELIAEWLETYPSDKGDPDLRHNALAGHVKTKEGLYYWASFGDPRSKS